MPLVTTFAGDSARGEGLFLSAPTPLPVISTVGSIQQKQAPTGTFTITTSATGALSGSFSASATASTLTLRCGLIASSSLPATISGTPTPTQVIFVGLA